LLEDEAEVSSLSWLHGKEACHGVTTSAGGEAAPRMRMGGDDFSWANANLTGPKNKKNPRVRFGFYK
jgi:hypothetical protein